VAARRLHLDVPDEELAARKAAWAPPPKRYPRSYGVLVERHISQADKGADFDFLERGGAVPEPEIF
jgi:dihydroxy-acid dehydratase